MSSVRKRRRVLGISGGDVGGATLAVPSSSSSSRAHNTRGARHDADHNDEQAAHYDRLRVRENDWGGAESDDENDDDEADADDDNDIDNDDDDNDHADATDDSSSSSRS